MLAALLFWMTVPAMAAEPAVCSPMPADFDAPQWAGVTDVAALSAAARCWYAVGRYGMARDALTRAGGGESAEDAAVLVILIARDGRQGDAQRALTAASHRFPGHSALTRASLVQRIAAGDHTAWADLDQGLSRAPGDHQLVLAAAEMTALAPDAATPAARAAVGQEEGAAALYNSAALRAESGDAPGCLSGTDRALGLLTQDAGSGDTSIADLRARLLVLRHRCAVEDGQLAPANAALRAIGPRQAREMLSPAALILHAKLLQQAGDPRSGARLLGLRSRPSDASQSGDLQGVQDSLELHLWREADELDRALAVAQRGAASPEARANLAKALSAADRKPEARALLEHTCPDMRGNDRRACESLKARLPQP